MAKCKYCGAEVAIGARCTYCGSKAERAGTILEKKRNRSLKRRKPHMIE